MARRKMQNSDPTKDRKTKRLTVLLDNETMRIINRVKRHVNFSAWLRAQLKFHYGHILTDDQKRERLKEEAAIAYQEKLDLIEKANKQYEKKMQALGLSTKTGVDTEELEEGFKYERKIKTTVACE